MELPLSGVTVIDLTHLIAGPYCTKLLAGLGADVIKVEPPWGEPARRLGPFPGDVPDSEKSGTFLYLNTGKKDITLNLKTESGREILKRLLRHTDVMVENFEPRVMAGFGLGYDVVSAINPRLVMTSISNFGQSGPYKDYRAEEMTVQAMGGFMYLNGYPEREPLKLGFAAAQYMGGLSGFSGTLAAHYLAEETGVGQQVDISLMECLAASHFETFERYSYTGRVARRNRTMLVFPCKDGTVQVGLQPHHWPKLPQMISMPGLMEDPRFKNTESRVRHAQELETILLPWMMEHTMEEIYSAGQSVGLPVGFMASAEDVFNSHQLKARGFWVDIEHPVAGKLTYAGPPLVMGDLPWQNERAPLLGEHNVSIYRDKLGYSREDIVRLRQLGSI